MDGKKFPDRVPAKSVPGDEAVMLRHLAMLRV